MNVLEIIEKKGDLSISALTLNEFIKVIKYVLLQEDDALDEDSPTGKRLLGQKDLCIKLGISRTTLYNLRNKNLIPEYLVNNRLRYDLHEVYEAIKVRNQDSSSS